MTYTYHISSKINLISSIYVIDIITYDMKQHKIHTYDLQIEI